MFKKSEKSAAPSLRNVKSKSISTQTSPPSFKPIPKSPSQPEHKLPKIMLFGCGGCGTNLVQKFCSQFEDINSKIDKCVVDTSTSNYNKELGLPLYQINLGSIGSGKYRPENYNVISAFIEDFVKSIKTKIFDIGVLVFSTNGGSGSIIGPLLGKELLKLGKKIILVCLTNDISEIDITNTLNTLNTLHNIAKNHYIPLGLFYNNDRIKVDQTVLEFLNINLTLLLNTGLEIDFTDKMNWLNPKKVINDINPGLHLMCVLTDKDDKLEVEEFIDNKTNNGYILPYTIESVDSFFIIKKEVPEYQPELPIRLLYHGYDNTIDEDYIISIILPNSIPQEFINTLYQKKESLKINTDNNLKFDNSDAIVDDDIVL